MIGIIGLADPQAISFNQADRKLPRNDVDLDYLVSLESMEGFAPPDREHTEARSNRILRVLRAVYPGLLVAGTIGIAATWLSMAYHAPVMLFALLLGMAFNFLHQDGRCKQGVEFASRTVLRFGVALLGLRLTFSQVVSLGPSPGLMVITGVATTIFAGVWIAKLLGLSRSFGLLSGGAVAICGASAALAISTTLPQYRERERDTIVTVIGVTTLSTIAMVLYPGLVGAFHLDHVQAGIFLGGTIHDVAQVVGAGYMISPETGDLSTYVKLIRVAMLIPATFVISLIMYRGSQSRTLRGTIPLFLVGFLLLVALNSLVDLGGTVHSMAGNISNWCLVTAISALGMKTSFADLIKVGWKPLGLMVAETAWLCALVLAWVWLI